MQFIWKYIDDFMGKGLEYSIIAELLFYASANLVSLALPLAVLLSSIMTFGSLAEQYELVAMKSSGLSLFRILAPLIVFISLTASGAFYFNNNLAPMANLKFKSLLWDVTHAKPSMELSDGVFYNGIDGYSLRVTEKDKKTNVLHDLLIYEHNKKNPGNKRVIRAKEGVMEKTADGRYMTLNLKNGVSYDEIGDVRDKDHPQIRSEFEQDIIVMDLSSFDMQRTDEDLWKNHMKMLSMQQLQTSIDSLVTQKEKRNKDFLLYMDRRISFSDTVETDSVQVSTLAPDITSASERRVTALPPDSAASFDFNDLSVLEQRRVVNVAINITRNGKNYMNRTQNEIENRDEYINKHRIEWHRKLTLSFACVILFFIGAPLGAIIKKGGLGLPVIFSVVFFLIFHISSMTGEKMVESGVLLPFTGMWLSSMILLPIAIFLTYKAANDAALFDRDTYIRIVNRILGFFKPKKHQVN